MIEFSVSLANRPGQLATLTRELGKANVNIQSLAAVTMGPEGIVKMVVDREEAARGVLNDAGVAFNEHRVVTAVLDDQPGALADMAEALAATGVNIDGIYLLGTINGQLRFALAVDDTEQARRHLSD